MIMKSERATFYLCDSKRNEIQKVVWNEEKQEEEIKGYSSQKGIVGYVANTFSSLISGKVQDDTRFNPEVDDPAGGGSTKYLITAPVECKDESQASRRQMPRGVL